MATGAELTDCDVITQPLLSAADMETRMSAWLAEVDAHEGGRERAVVAHFGTVKRNLTESGKDFSVCVEAPCHRYVPQTRSVAGSCSSSSDWDSPSRPVVLSGTPCGSEE